MSGRATTSRLFGTLLLSLLVASLATQGCIPPPNQQPVANAGADQTVAFGASVTLNGAGSSDPDGDTLTFSWTQTAGTVVALSGANTSTASFTAPSNAETLTFQLAVDDGNGGTNTDSTNVTVQTTIVPTTPQLYISSQGGNNVVSYANPSTINGNIVPTTNLAGVQTQITGPVDIIVNSADQLLVANGLSNSITTYNDAPSTNGNLAPDGNVLGAATQLVGPVSLAINATQDILFVANLTTLQINVYINTTQTTFNGNLAPTRIITSFGNIAAPFGINFGAGDDLYVANGVVNNVLVFANASNLNGNIAPTRVITSATFAAVIDVFVDASDNLFVVNSGGTIDIFNNAATLNGAVAPDFTLTVPPAVSLTAIAVDSSDIGYIVDRLASAVYSYDNISTLNGVLAPDRTIAGVNTQMLLPLRVFLAE